MKNLLTSRETFINIRSMKCDDLKKHRKSLGLTQEKLADYLGITGVHVCRLESGSRPIMRQTELAVLAMVEKVK